jgi:hypothetical protein
MTSSYAHTFETQIFPTLVPHPSLFPEDKNFEKESVFISGQWMFAKAASSYGEGYVLYELPWSIGIITPLSFDSSLNEFHDNCKSPDWYKRAFLNSYLGSINKTFDFKVHKRRPVKDIWFVNCLMPYYGDCVSLLLRTSALRSGPRDTVFLVPSPLLRMVPDWAAEVWEIDISQDFGYRIALEWNPEFNRRIVREFMRFNSVFLPHLFQPANPEHAAVKDFFKLEPFNLDLWHKIPPTVTFVWREDRLSPPELKLPSFIDRMLLRFSISKPIRNGLKMLNLLRYRNFILATAQQLKKQVPGIKINVIGKGRYPPLPQAVDDHRVASHSLETDRSDEKIASLSHILVSAHGSHLVGISALPGSVIQLIPLNKWENWLDAVSIRDRDLGGWLNYISLASDISYKSLAALIEHQLKNKTFFRVAYSPQYSSLCEANKIKEIRSKFY